MSALFLAMVGDGTAGQSVGIAVAKLAGSAIPWLGYVLFYPSQARLYVLTMGAAIFRLDIAYLWGWVVILLESGLSTTFLIQVIIATA